MSLILPTSQTLPERQTRVTPPQGPHVARVRFNTQARKALVAGARRIVELGGAQTPGVQAVASLVAHRVRMCLDEADRQALEAYEEGKLAAIVFEEAGLHATPTPIELPQPEALSHDGDVQALAARHQILLALVCERAFAYDIENDGLIMRLVANFAGGGAIALEDETAEAAALKSSHHGGLLGAHSEGPYYATQNAWRGHSPAPSSLVLTAQWNPRDEPTLVLPIRPIMRRLSGLHVLALTQPHFCFATSDSYDAPREPPAAVPLVEMDANGEFVLRYNAHRVDVAEGAPPPAAAALEALSAAVAGARPVRVTLKPHRALLINNSQALHGRDQVRDNRRLLIRYFGIRPSVTPAVANADPLIVFG